MLSYFCAGPKGLYKNKFIELALGFRLGSVDIEEQFGRAGKESICDL